MSAHNPAGTLNTQNTQRGARAAFLRLSAWVTAYPWVWVVALTAAAFLLRRYRLGAESFWFDEADIVKQAQQSPLTLLQNFTQAGENGPLYTLILHYWLAFIDKFPTITRGLHLLFGSEMEAPVRGLAAVFGTAAIPLMYALGRRVGGRALGFTAAILLTVNPFDIWHSQDAKMYTLLVLASLASTLLYVTALEKNTWKLWAGYVLATWVMLTVHSMAGLVLLAQLLGTPFLVGRRTRSEGRETRDNNSPAVHRPPSALPRRRYPWWIGWGWAMLLILTPVFPILWLRAAAIITGTVNVGWANAAGLTDILSTIFVAFAVNRANPPWETLGALSMFLLAVVGAWVLIRQSRWSNPLASDEQVAPRNVAPVIVGLWLVPIAAFWLVTLRVPIFQSRYLIMALPPYLILAAAGLLLLGRVHPAAFAVAAGVVGLASLAALSGVNYSTQAQKEDWRGAMVYVQDHLRLRDAIVVFPGYLVTAVNVYYQPGGAGQVPIVPIISSIPSLSTQNFGQRELETVLRQTVSCHERIWLVTSPDRQKQEDPLNQVQQWYQYNWHTFDTHVFNGVTVYGISFDGQPDCWFPPPDYPEVHAYTNGVSFLGYIYEIRAGATAQRDASYFPLTMYWQTDRQLTEDYIFRVQIKDQSGKVIVDDAQGFLNGYGHASEWHPGTIYIDYRDLRLPGGLSPGNYTVTLQAYPKSHPDQLLKTTNRQTQITFQTPLQVVPFAP